MAAKTGLITLEGMEFFVYHGYYDAEQQVGNRYLVDLKVEANLQAAAETDRLAETVNYEVLYAIVAEEMQIKTRLLEHVAHRILDKVQERFKEVLGCSITISKSNPSLGGLCKAASITLYR